MSSSEVAATPSDSEAESQGTPFPRPLPSPISEELLASINAYLSELTPEQILKWGLEHLPNLYQTTAFGLTGLVAIDMLSKMTDSPPPLIFIDTLYHFKETYELVEEVKERYGYVSATAGGPDVGSKRIYVYKPQGCENVQDFEKRYGTQFWEKEEIAYDLAVKVEPARRAYQELGVQSVITGRRASQGGDRAKLQPLEVDSTGLFKLNPLYSWPFSIVDWHISYNNVPRNKLLDQGYKSIGDWHSTSKVKEGEGERDGRWKGKEKTECGLHVDYFALKAKAIQPAAPVVSPAEETVAT